MSKTVILKDLTFEQLHDNVNLFIKEQNEKEPLKTNFYLLDKHFIGGIPHGEFTVFCGSPSKSYFEEYIKVLASENRAIIVDLKKDNHEDILNFLNS